MRKLSKQASDKIKDFEKCKTSKRIDKKHIFVTIMAFSKKKKAGMAIAKGDISMVAIWSCFKSVRQNEVIWSLFGLLSFFEHFLKTGFGQICPLNSFWTWQP